MKKKNFWAIIWEYSYGYRTKLIISMAICLIAGAAVAYQPIIIKYILDDGISNEALSGQEKIITTAFWCGVYILVTLVRMGSWAIAYKTMLKGIEGFLFNMRSRLFLHIQSLCMRFYDNTSSGELFNYIMGTPMNNIKEFLSQFSSTTPMYIVSLFVSITAMLSYDWLLTVIMLVGIILCIFINIFERKKLKSKSVELLKSESEASKYIDDMLHGTRAIKMYAIEDNVISGFTEHIGELKEKGARLNYAKWKGSAVGEFSQYVITACIYLAGAYSCVYRDLTIGELVAFITSYGVIMSAFTNIFNINLLRATAESAMDRIYKVLNIHTTTPESERTFNIEEQSASAKKQNLPCIKFNDVDFAYNEKNIFEKFNCEIRYNESVALVGASGSGKTTITKLIMRLYETDKGSISIYGKNIKDFSLHDLRKSIGIVPQDPFIFQASIMENIRMAYPEAPMQEVIKAMDIARVHEFVNDLPKGWNTVIGGDGYSLSGGQKQRIAIARAILGNPQLLIFDEATSALDNISEHHIQLAMEDLMKTHTVIIVAHRLTTIKNVDRILVFDKGDIVEEGTFEELSQKEGMFKDMLDASIKN